MIKPGVVACSKKQLRRKNVENMISLTFPRLTYRYQWKSKIVLIYAIFLGLVQVVGEKYGEVSHIDNYIVT